MGKNTTNVNFLIIILMACHKRMALPKFNSMRQDRKVLGAGDVLRAPAGFCWKLYPGLGRGHTGPHGTVNLHAVKM